PLGVDGEGVAVLAIEQVSGDEDAGGGGLDADLDEHGGEDAAMIDAEALAFLDRLEVPQRGEHLLDGLAQGLLAADVGHRVVETGAAAAGEFLGVGRAANEDAAAAEPEPHPLVDGGED